MEDFDDSIDSGDSFEYGSKLAIYRQEYENHIKRNIYKEIRKDPEQFINGDYIPNRVNLVKGLITFYEESLEYEKCGVLLKIQNKITDKKVIKKTK